MKSHNNFRPATKEVIEQLRNIIILRNEKCYQTKGEFYREIELLKFPYLKNWKGASTQKLNQYSQQQYDIILDYCKDMGWISISPKNGRSFYVHTHSSVAFDKPTNF